MARIIGSLIAHAFSYLATLAFVAYILKPTDGPSWAGTVAAALAVEAFGYALKELLWKHSLADPLGWVGVAFDGIINTGGILPYAPRVLTFGPISLSLGFIGVNIGDPLTAVAASGVISLVAGVLLSIAPHWLWHSGGKRGKA
jgi:hypothetical protein